MTVSGKLEEAYVQRMPADLRAEVVALPEAERAAILGAMVRFHQAMEEETFVLVRGMIRARGAEK